MLVVGAGPTGLVLALSLARRGVAVRIVDRRAGISRESRALDVQARTLELYAQLGVADAVVGRGTRIERVVVRDRGRRVSEVDVHDLGRGLSAYPYLLCCPQDEHEAVLVAALAGAGVEVEWQTELTALSTYDDRVDVTLAGPGGRVEEVRVDYVGGCDGGRSRVREQLGVAFDGTDAEQEYFVADVETPDADGGSFSFGLTAEDFVLAVPARRTGTVRLIGLLPSALAGGRAVTFADVRPLVERAAGIEAEAVRWFSTYRVASRVAARLRVGRTFLLGDAAHLHSPLGGQGMNTGIADAVNLAWKLAAVLEGRAAAALLDSYEAERLGVARALVRGTERASRLITGAGWRPRVVRGWVFRRLLPAVLRLPPTRRALARGVSQVGLSYRSSPWIAGRAGTLRGGDRLPWVDLGDGLSNLDPLTSLAPQVHVYGTPGPGLVAAAAAGGLVLHAYPWTAGARAAGLRRHALYLVRPDGYLALVDPKQRVDRLARALDQIGHPNRRLGSVRR